MQRVPDTPREKEFFARKIPIRTARLISRNPPIARNLSPLPEEWFMQAVFRRFRVVYRSFPRRFFRRMEKKSAFSENGGSFAEC
jgi:hypothetical protein